MTIIYRASLETHRFLFEGFGLTEREARDAVVLAARIHSKQYQLSMPFFTSDDINSGPVELGRPYRDGQLLGAT